MDSIDNLETSRASSLQEETVGPGVEVGAGHPVRPGLRIFCPHREADAVTNISPEELYRLGIRGVILDLDNTLVLWQKEEIADDVFAWLKALQATGMKLAILSNSILSKRSERIAVRLGCFNVRKARKPSLSGFRRAMTMMETRPATTAMIGDQMFTDVWGGNRAGVYTIMVKQMQRREFVYTRFISRLAERWLLRLFRKQGFI